MAASMMVARLAVDAARMGREAEAMRARAEEARAALAGIAYPAAWEAEEEEAWAQAVAFHLEALWADRRGRRSILALVREATGGRMIAPPQGTREEWRTSVPAHYLRARGMRADDLATCLGYAGEDELRDAIQAEAGTLACAKADLLPEAQRLAAEEPIFEEYAGRRADHAEAVALAEEAALDAGALADLAAEAARAADTARARLVIAAGALADVAMAAARATGDAGEVAMVLAAMTRPAGTREEVPEAPAAGRRARRYRRAPSARSIAAGAAKDAAATVGPWAVGAALAILAWTLGAVADLLAGWATALRPQAARPAGRTAHRSRRTVGTAPAGTGYAAWAERWAPLPEEAEDRGQRSA